MVEKHERRLEKGESALNALKKPEAKATGYDDSVILLNSTEVVDFVIDAKRLRAIGNPGRRPSHL